MSLSLSRREVILTQLCTLRYRETDLISQALRQIPRILEVLDLTSTNPDEIYSFLKELQICRTDIALKTYIIYLSHREKSFRFFPTRALWTQKNNKDIHLVIHLRGQFTDRDRQDFFTHPEISRWIQGPYTYIMTPPEVTEECLEKLDICNYVKNMFSHEEQEVIFKFLLVEEVCLP
jgi:hypothetical protein